MTGANPRRPERSAQTAFAESLPEPGPGNGSRATAREKALPRILYVAGLPKSGSTVLGHVLGGIPDAIFVGELEAFWRHLAKNEQCSCGLPLRGCPFWSVVVEKAFGQVTQEQAHEFSSREKTVFRRQWLLVVAPQWVSRKSQRIGVVVRERARLYRAIREVANATCVVDSSKEVRYGGILARMGADFSTIHIVRDPRGAAFSWQKGRLDALPEVEARSAMKPAFYWVRQNLLVQFLLQRLGNAYVRVRYEDLVQRPADIRRTIAEVTSVTCGNPHPPTTALVEAQHHWVRGNRRVRKRVVEGMQLSLDEEWRAGMPRGQRWLVTGVCGLMMVVYGYPLGSSRPFAVSG